MYNSDTELLFPVKILPYLESLRDEEWRELVRSIIKEEVGSINRFAFVLMMVRLSGCVSCSTHSFRSMRGCRQCAQQTIRRFRGTDQDLINHFRQSCLEIDQYLRKSNNE